MIKSMRCELEDKFEKSLLILSGHPVLLWLSIFIGIPLTIITALFAIIFVLWLPALFIAKFI